MSFDDIESGFERCVVDGTGELAQATADLRDQAALAQLTPYRIALAARCSSEVLACRRMPSRQFLVPRRS
jgi:hypothetical protein